MSTRGASCEAPPTTRPPLAELGSQNSDTPMIAAPSPPRTPINAFPHSARSMLRPNARAHRHRASEGTPAERACEATLGRPREARCWVSKCFFLPDTDGNDAFPSYLCPDALVCISDASDANGLGNLPTILSLDPA